MHELIYLVVYLVVCVYYCRHTCNSLFSFIIFFLGFIALLADAFEEKDLADMTGDVSKQTVLHLHPSLAPYKVALYSNMTDTNELTEVSNQLASELRHAGKTMR